MYKVFLKSFSIRNISGKSEKIWMTADTDISGKPKVKNRVQEK
jgi:hypothetical protein